MYWGAKSDKYEYFEIAGKLLGLGKSEEKKEEDNLLFKDPAEYEKWSPEKRKQMTDKMMGYHKVKMGETALGDSNAE